jgi:hypothetical protein
MKQRAKLNTKSKRKKFLRAASKGCISFPDLPKGVAEFCSFISYMKRMSNKVRGRNTFCYLYLYKDYFLIISVDGLVITILNIDEGYYGIYDQIVKYLEAEEEEKAEEQLKLPFCDISLINTERGDLVDER